MTEKELRRKVLLPAFQLTELCDQDSPRALTRTIKQGVGRERLTYHYRAVVDDESGAEFSYNLFPVVLDRSGVPWPLGTLFILSKLENRSNPEMTTFQNLVDDLGAFKEWLDQYERPEELMFNFPRIKLRRPTYRYHGFLEKQKYAQEISPRTAQRRMGTVIALYRWLVDNKFFEPEYPLWEERAYKLYCKNVEGFSISKSVMTTDVSIKVAKAKDPFDGTIQDGGELRPLMGEEQQWVLDAAYAKGNAEAYLLQLLMLGTGARIQSACTMRVRHVTDDKPKFSKALGGDGEVFRLRAGPGTGIDTKGNKSGVLQIPRPLYEILRTYARSERAKKRRLRAFGGDNPDQYLFLTQQGNPYYVAKSETLGFDPEMTVHHRKAGQTLRQFLKDQAIPYIRERHDRTFHYRIHDLRASFGMNMTEIQSALVQKGIISFQKARMNVKDLMWHERFETTDNYLDYRSQMEAAYAAVNSYGEQLQLWIERAAHGLDLNGQGG